MRVRPSEEEAPHVTALLGAAGEYLRAAGMLTMPLPGVGTLVFSAGSPRTKYTFEWGTEEEDDFEGDDDSDE